MINKSFLCVELVRELDNYQDIGVMRRAHKQILASAQQQTNARLQLPLLARMIASRSMTPWALKLTGAQMTLSMTYKFFEVCKRGDCREPEDRRFIVCAQSGGPENADEMAIAYRSAHAAAAGDEGGERQQHSAGVAAARATARRPAASSTERPERSNRAEDYGLGPDVPGGWHVTSVMYCSCQMFTHHG